LALSDSLRIFACAAESFAPPPILGTTTHGFHCVRHSNSAAARLGKQADFMDLIL
jgi:hypothetical protein